MRETFSLLFMACPRIAWTSRNIRCIGLLRKIAVAPLAAKSRSTARMQISTVWFASKRRYGQELWIVVTA
jgi:hypothetical protein